jgi:hypothetical protein
MKAVLVIGIILFSIIVLSAWMWWEIKNAEELPEDE